jgi:sodium-dependent dicarboxylate transporter 2/3/5
MVATICASYAFMLPIATPPNAIAMSSNVLTIKDMAKFGIVFNIVAILLTTTIAMILW